MTISLQPATETLVADRVGSDFARLSRQVREVGLLRRRPLAYSRLVSLTLVLFLGVCVGIALLGNSWLQLLVAVGLGFVFTQIAFLGHDGGHQQVFRSRRANDLFGRLTGNLLVGLSFGWWVGKHNRHHANPNQEDYDPDIGDGALAFTTNQIARRTGGLGRLIARRQAWLFFPLLTLEGLNLHLASIRSLLTGDDRSSRGGARRTEACLLGVHFACYIGGLLVVMSPWKALAFIAVNQAAFGFYMGCSFAPNHKGMPTVAANETLDYLRKQVLTSRNVRGNVMTDWLLGGLNYQVEHHLFPSMPRASLRLAQPLVVAFCTNNDILYTETSLFGSYRAALRHLHELGAPLRKPVRLKL